MKKPFRRGLAMLSILLLGVGMWALPMAPIQPVETAAATTDIVKIACIGASTTLGNGSTSWPAETQKLVGGLCEVKNFGVNSRTVIADGTETGDTTQKLAYTLTPEYTSSLEYQADYVLIMLGGNDAKPVNWKDGNNTFTEDYKALVAAYQEQGAEVIVVIEPWVKGEAWGINEPTMADGVRPAYKAIAQELGLKTIDLFAVTENQGDLYSDGVHMNSAGYKVLGETVSAALKEFGIVPEGSEDVPCRPSSSIADFYGEFDGYEVMQWLGGTTGYFNYTGGMLASQMGIEESTVVSNLTINVSYYWDGATTGNNWWHFNTTDKNGLSAPSKDGSTAHDNGYGQFLEYGMTNKAWSTLTVSRDEQMLGGSGSDWYVYVGGLNQNSSLYIRGFEVIATLEDGTVKTVKWGTMKDRRGADDGETLKIACVGASTTRGNNVASDKGTSYPSFLQMMLGNNCEVKNFGYPGASATKRTDAYAYLSYIDSVYHKNSLAYMADIVIIDLGVNDSQTATWNMGTFQQDFEELVNSYLTQGNDPLVLLSTGGHCTKNTWDTTDWRIEELIQPAQIAVAEKYDLPTADMRALLLSDPEAYVCPEDGVHYTDLGHKAMAQLYYDTLLPLIEIPEGDEGGEDDGAMMDPPDCAVSIGEYDGYRCLMWENGQTGGFSYSGGALAFALGVDSGTVVDSLTFDVSYYWDSGAVNSNWWHFDSTDKDGNSAPPVVPDASKPYDNGFGTFVNYGMQPGAWNEMSVTRTEQLLGGNDWSVNVGMMAATNSLYIRGFKVTATLADGTVKEASWGVYALTSDKAALDTALEEEVTDLSTYTEETAAAYTAALEAAKAVSADKFATQEQIDAAATALTEAKAALTVKPEPEKLLGDVNGDNEVNTTDARLVLQYAVEKITADELDLSVANVNKSEKVDTTDARLILQFAVDKIEDFG